MPPARILLADDHDIARQGVAAILSSEPGFEICGQARSGRDAVAMAARLQPDIVIMDILMPDLNGLDAARQMKKHSPALRILILSGHEDASLIHPAFEAGISAYIFKTQARDHLFPAIHALLAGKPYLTMEASEALLGGIPLAQRLHGEPDPDSALTAREREIIQLLAEGRSNKEVASTLDIAIKTVETHRASIMRKLNLESLSEIVLYAIRRKIIEP